MAGVQVEQAGNFLISALLRMGSKKYYLLILGNKRPESIMMEKVSVNMGGKKGQSSRLIVLERSEINK